MKGCDRVVVVLRELQREKLEGIREQTGWSLSRIMRVLVDEAVVDEAQMVKLREGEWVRGVLMENRDA